MFLFFPAIFLERIYSATSNALFFLGGSKSLSFCLNKLMNLCNELSSHFSFLDSLLIFSLKELQTSGKSVCILLFSSIKYHLGLLFLSPFKAIKHQSFSLPIKLTLVLTSDETSLNSSYTSSEIRAFFPSLSSITD